MDYNKVYEMAEKIYIRWSERENEDRDDKLSAEHAIGAAENFFAVLEKHNKG